ncbi:3-ketoacyl-thiolase peroxisomal [Micractinium conductrix]|uniref:acetyl-CoA C-acyltransferase n=1 Tax=Micractinium conductrix TaxID=554055 RepID=A0A2P6VGA6_9CHLO|nr:3-ketoacyl-thiolase peroxisomal [Micractinium conductrix]|eukprot:PSC73107.1 3-ketoacyl-thiolase peroxisomal [Micractinium conductrix]
MLQEGKVCLNKPDSVRAADELASNAGTPQLAEALLAEDIHADELVVTVLQECLRRADVKPQEVGDVCLGSVFPPSSKRANEVRAALLLAGFPNKVPAYTVNRQCAAGLQAIANVAAGIKAGYYDIAIAGGIEHLTKDPLDWQGSDNPRVLESPDAKDVGLALGLTAENVAEKYGVPREEQDRLAAASHAKAAAAQASGKFVDEIATVHARVTDPKTGDVTEVSVDHDDSIRADTSYDKLHAMKPYFKKDGTVTAGNACQNTDCAAAMLLMRRAEAEKRGLPILGVLRSFATVGVPPGVMGTAPTLAIPKALERAGLRKEDVEVFELNEAFASQTAYCLRELGLPEEKVNVNGGAIALGHPAGATGARITVSLLHELARRSADEATSSGSADHEGGSVNGNEQKPRYGVVALCTGAGMGAAAVFEGTRSTAGSASFSRMGSTSSAADLGSTSSAADMGITASTADVPSRQGDDDAVLGTVLVNQRALRNGPAPEEDPDLALAKMLQAQEQAWLAMAGGSGALENLPLGGGGGAPGGAAEPAAAAEGGDGEELTDEEMARRLQEDEEREFQARLLALAGVGPAGVAAGGGDGAADDGGGDAEGGDAGNEGYLTEDDADPDELTYEELTALGEAVGTVSRGLPQAAIDALPTAQYYEVAGTAGAEGAEAEEQCPICRVEYEPEDKLRVLPLCRHYYHLECIAEWLCRNKACCICNKEVVEEKGGSGGNSSGAPAAQAPAEGASSEGGVDGVLGDRRRQEGLALLCATKHEAGRLAHVEELLAEHHRRAAAAGSAASGTEPPSVVRGLLVRYRLEGGYHLRQAQRAEVAPDGSGKPLFLVQDPRPDARSPLRKIPIHSLSGTNTLVKDDQWDKAGRGEVAALIAFWRHRGEAPTVAEAAAAAWRKQVALGWEAQYGGLPTEEVIRHLPMLLAVTRDAPSIVQAQKLFTAEPSPVLPPVGSTRLRLAVRTRPEEPPLPTSAYAPADPYGGVGAARNAPTAGGAYAGAPPDAGPGWYASPPAAGARWDASPRANAAAAAGVPRRSARDRQPSPPPRSPTPSPSPRRAALAAPAGVAGVAGAAPAEEAPLAPVLLRHFRRAVFKPTEEWELIGREVQATGLAPTVSERMLEAAFREAGATVRDVRVTRQGDPRGELGFVLVASASQAAALVERLQGAKLEGRRMFLRGVRNEIEFIERTMPEAAAVAKRVMAVAAAGHARSPAHAGGPFWDPVWQLEWDCAQRLRAAEGPLPLQQLLKSVEWPRQVFAASPGCLPGFLARRPFLFDLQQGGGGELSVSLLPGAKDWLMYKHALLQYLADHPPRVPLRQLEEALPPPASLPACMRGMWLSKLMEHYLSCEVWSAAGRTAYRDPRTVTVELQPFSAGAGGPRFPRICGHFRGLAALDCPDQERCELPHAPQRVFKRLTMTHRPPAGPLGGGDAPLLPPHPGLLASAVPPAAALAPTRKVLSMLLATKSELGRLAQVEALAEYHHGLRSGAQPPPSVLHGVLARVKLMGRCRLRLVAGAEAAAEAGGAPSALLLQAPEAGIAGGAPPLRRLPIEGISSTNPLDDQHWEAAGSGEVAELAAAWQACGYALPLAEALGAAWRKQAALQWHAQQWQQAPDERLRQVPSLLAALADAGGLALMQQQLAALQADSLNYDLPAAAAALSAALYRAVPASEPGAAAKRAALSALLHLGLACVDGVEGSYCQLPVPAVHVQEALREAAARDRQVAGQLAMLALQPSASALPLAARLLTDCHDRRLVSLSGGAADTCQLLLHVDHLAEAYLGGGGGTRLPAAPGGAPTGGPAGLGLAISTALDTLSADSGSTPDASAAAAAAAPSRLDGPACLGAPAAAMPPSPWELLTPGGGPPVSPTRSGTRSAGSIRSAGSTRSVGGTDDVTSGGPTRWHGVGGGGAPPAGPPLVPLLLPETEDWPAEWVLTGSMLYCTRIPKAAAPHELHALLESAGVTVLSSRLLNGDRRGNIAFVQLGSARQVALAVQRLHGAKLCGSTLEMRESAKELEWDCCQLLQTAGRPLDSWELLAGVAAHVPPQLGRPISGVLSIFLSRRPHLFSLSHTPGSLLVSLVPGAEPFMKYKRALLQYLADHPPRVELHVLEAALPPPRDLHPSIGRKRLADILAGFLKDEGAPAGDRGAASPPLLLGPAALDTGRREGVSQLVASKKELGQLAQVEHFLAGAHHSTQPPGTQPPPSVLSGVLARFKSAGQYHLRPVVGVEAAAAGSGPEAVLFQAPEAAAAGAPPALRRIPLAAVSSANPCDEKNWEAAGHGEVAALAAAWQACGYALPLAEAAGAVWRKQAALQWHAQHGKQAAEERQQHIPALLAALADTEGLARVPAGDLPAAQAALADAISRVVPASERDAAAKRAALSALLRLGLLPYGVQASSYRQLRVSASDVQEAMREVAARRTGGRAAGDAGAAAQRKRSRSCSPVRGHGGALHLPLEPLLLRHSDARPSEWVLCSQELYISGIHARTTPEELRAALEGAGATLKGLRMKPGDVRGSLAYAMLPSAQDAVALVLRLQGVQVGPNRIFLREQQRRPPAQLSAQTPRSVALNKEDRVQLAPGAVPFLTYKRALLQYLADHRPRVRQRQLEAAMPRPAELPASMHGQAFYLFLYRKLGREQ